MTPPSLTSADQSHDSSGRSSTSPVLTPLRGQNAVAVSVLKRSPPPVAVTQSRKGGVRRLKKEKRMEEEEDMEDVDLDVVDMKKTKEEEELELVCPQSFNSITAEKIAPKKEEDEEEEENDVNGIMEIEDDSGTEEKEKELLR